MIELLKEEDWAVLVQRLKIGKCTPFLGAGAAAGVLPLGGGLAQEWAEQFSYPLKEDTDDLARVAQYLALQHDPMFPKFLLIEQFNKMFAAGRVPDFKDRGEPHRVLAGFPLPIYLTTNYDSFMTQALQYVYRAPKQELCRWNRAVEGLPSVFDQTPAYAPEPANPLVFHLHGYAPEASSLVLTEDDYMDFLVNIALKPKLLPPPVEHAIASSSLLFIGYRIADWNFRVLLRSLSRYMEKSQYHTHIAVMRPPAGGEPNQEKVKAFLTKFYENINVRVYWGDARDFLAELQQRWVAAQ
jgi:hypothetical protein